MAADIYGEIRLDAALAGGIEGPVSRMSQWNQQALLQQAVRESYERLDAEMESLLKEWETVRRAYERVNGTMASSAELDATQTGEWEAVQDASDGLLRALDGMLYNTYTRLPQRLSMLRGKVSGFAHALTSARRLRRAMATPAPIPVETLVRRHMIGTGV